MENMNGAGNGGNMNNSMQDPNRRPPKKKHSGLVVALIVIAVIIMLLSAASFIGRMFLGALGPLGGTTSTTADDSLNFSSPYIGELMIEGTIQASEDAFSDEGYHHTWTLKKLQEMRDDSMNKGLILFVNTPGGGVYESDELYLAIKDYQKATGRPVYAYMGSMAASGGYYISAPSDKIYANRNCWTGSIGVTLGTMYDITGLLKKYGVKTVTIDSGDNKSMGSYTEEMTDEQKKILQSLVDEAYDQFVGIVADGRKMDKKEVKKLADGRIYTAKQAKENKLIDEVGTLQEAADDMRKKFELEGVPVKQIKYMNETPLLYRLLSSFELSGKDKLDTDLDKLKALMESGNKFTVTYLAEIDR